MGPGRAFEALLSSDDFPAQLAERALHDAELNTFVDAFARRAFIDGAGRSEVVCQGLRQAPVRDLGPGSGVCAASWPGACSGVSERERTAGARRPGASREAVGLRTSTAETTASTITTAP